MIFAILLLVLAVGIGTYMITRLITRQKYRQEMWETVAAMQVGNLKTMEFRQKVLDTIILSDLSD